MDKGRLEAFSDGVIAIIITMWIVPDIRMEQIFEETNRGNE